jgi:hypothetical protein
MTIPNFVVPGFTLVYTTAFGTAIQNSAVTGTWILDALTVSPGSVTVAYSARSTGNIESLAGQYTFAPGSAAAFGYQFWVDPTSTAAAIASIRGPEGETYSVAGTETYDGVNATVLSFSGPTASSVVIYQTSTGLILHESASYPNSAEILEFSTVLNSPPPPPAPNPAPPAGTTADMILRNASGTYEIYDIGNNAILAGYKLGQVGTDWGYVTVGGFFGSDTTDMLLRSATTGGFEVYDIANNNITGAAFLGTVGLNWQVMGFGNFSSMPGETDMILRNSNTGGVEVYNISNNQITGAAFMGTVGLNWQFSGVGNFSGRGESDMLLRNSNTGGLEVYDIANNAITGAAFIGTIGLDWQFSGVGNFSGVPGETDLLLRNVNTGGLEVYNINNNQLTGAAFLGTVGLDWQFAGIAPIHAAGASDLVLRNVNTGAFEVYNITNNQLTGAAPLGSVGLDWQLGGFATDPPTGSMGGSGGQSDSTSQLVQAMAGFGGGGTAESLNTVPLAAETSQQQLLATPQHA